MKNSIVKIIEIKAGDTLKEFGITAAPVPVDEIAKKLGISISYAPSEDYSGMLIRKESGKSLMGINSDEPKTRIRFTIAHEIGHFIFDQKDKVTIDYRNRDTVVVNKPDEEIRADLFAANLLMPRKWIMLDFEKIPNGILSSEHIVDLAKKYKVSTKALKYRLINLGLARLS